MGVSYGVCCKFDSEWLTISLIFKIIMIQFNKPYMVCSATLHTMHIAYKSNKLSIYLPIVILVQNGFVSIAAIFFVCVMYTHSASYFSIGCTIIGFVVIILDVYCSSLLYCFHNFFIELQRTSSVSSIIFPYMLLFAFPYGAQTLCGLLS